MKERVFNYIKKVGYITTWDAFRELGCTRLSEYIRQLRMEHKIVCETIKTTNRFGEKTYYVKYRLVENEDDIETII